MKFQNYLSAFQHSSDLDPEKQAKRLAAPALVKKGEKLAKKGDLDAAVVQFKNALILDPDLDLEPYNSHHFR